ncbi:fused response regulator/phosphatase [Mucilaginibacter sp. PAMB04168]|uniref:PP2C family protein-serine/threonine phosphatase n=1 Tax=Mucilaginibacter sp. PAMB04168 TaxID=3138567 RepID=UPI0031F6197A
MTSASQSILLVDDNPLFLKLLAQAFTRAGFTCHTANSAPEALSMLKAQVPDIILSDYEMPEMNGLEFRQHLLDDAHLKDIPFVFLTAFDDQQIMYSGLDLRAIDYVIKDTPVDVIIAKINNLLHTVNMQRQLSELEIRKTVAALNIKAVPQKLPKINGFDIDLWHQDFQDIPGGDFIDFIEADDRYLFIILGDIMGKKWKAWFYTFTYLSYIRAAIRFGVSDNQYSGAAMLQKINEVIYHDEGLRDILCSLSLICLDKQTGQLSYTGAGDLPLLHYHSLTQEIRPIESTGLLLGMLPDGNYTGQPITLAEGDQLFLFTDGLTDFVADGAKKSDYQQFAGHLKQQLDGGVTFTEFKESLQKQSSKWVDDCSIIYICKNLPHA